MNRQTRMGQKRTKHTWPWSVYLNVQVYCRTLAYICRCLPCSVHWRYYQFAIVVLINIINNIFINFWKMIDQIIFPWKLHSDDWKSTCYYIKKYWRQLWRRVSTITSFDHYVGNVMTRLINIFIFLVIPFNWLLI
jgi:hypothetical protein